MNESLKGPWRPSKSHWNSKTVLKWVMVEAVRFILLASSTLWDCVDYFLAGTLRKGGVSGEGQCTEEDNARRITLKLPYCLVYRREPAFLCVHISLDTLLNSTPSQDRSECKVMGLTVSKEKAGWSLMCYSRAFSTLNSWVYTRNTLPNSGENQTEGNSGAISNWIGI